MIYAFKEKNSFFLTTIAKLIRENIINEKITI